VLVNNAGIYIDHPIADVGFDAWHDAWQGTLATNLVGPANLSYCVARHMMERGGGRIVNVSSRSAFRGEPDGPAYGASKERNRFCSLHHCEQLFPGDGRQIERLQFAGASDSFGK
jgi:NAD(P)-dependent dehydrogenase (short-subunit alcohol dehydrogenase family)